MNTVASFLVSFVEQLAISESTMIVVIVAIRRTERMIVDVDDDCVEVVDAVFVVADMDQS